MNILAIDPGMNLGWAIAIEGKLYESGVHRFTRSRSESAGAIYLKFRKWLLDTSSTIQEATGQDFHLIAFEMPHQRGGAATEILLNFVGRLKEHAALIEQRGEICEFAAVHTQTLKKQVTGSGNAGKCAVMAAMRQYWQMEITSDDHADALAVMAWALETYGG